MTSAPGVQASGKRLRGKSAGAHACCDVVELTGGNAPQDLESPSRMTPSSEDGSAVAPRRPRARRRVAWAVAGVVGFIAVVALSSAGAREGSESRRNNGFAGPARRLLQRIRRLRGFEPAAIVPIGDFGERPVFEQPLSVIGPEGYSEDDPHLCVLVSTYQRHGMRLTALLSSLISSMYGQLSLILVDTDPNLDSMEWLGHHARLFSHHVDRRGERAAVYVSEITQRTIMEEFPNLWNDYGYALSDRLIEELLKNKPGHGLPKEKCDYFMLTNGDNVYGARLIPALLPYMRSEYDAIGFDFTTHYMVDDNRCDHPGYSDQTILSQFRAHWIDKGAAVFRAENLRQHPLTFVLGALREHGAINSATLGFIPELADGMFFERLAAREGARSAIIRRTLFMHQ